MRKYELNKIGNLSQLGGIETSVLDNGPACGSRIAWFNTGGGLRFKVAVDRCLDIVDCFYNSFSLAWISDAGLSRPQLAANTGIQWLKTFSGGLLTTCGLGHVGPPECDEFGTRGVHGEISNIASMVESVIQPDPVNGQMEMSITAVTKQSAVLGVKLQLRRRISSVLGSSTIKIHDEVTNCGNTPAPHMILYHCNFGYPLVDAGAEIVYSGQCKSRGGVDDDAIFASENNCKKCLPPIDSHRGTGEACGFITPQADEDGLCRAAIANIDLGLKMELKFDPLQLPCLTNWQHFGHGEYVCALEPGTNFPVGQSAARKQGTLTFLQVGEKRCHDIEIEVSEA